MNALNMTIFRLHRSGYRSPRQKRDMSKVKGQCIKMLDVRYIKLNWTFISDNEQLAICKNCVTSHKVM